MRSGVGRRHRPPAAGIEVVRVQVRGWDSLEEAAWLKVEEETGLQEA